MPCIVADLPGCRRGAAYGGRINLPNDPINARLSIREVQDGYDPAVGFVDRRGYRLVNPAVRSIASDLAATWPWSCVITTQAS